MSSGLSCVDRSPIGAGVGVGVEAGVGFGVAVGARVGAGVGVGIDEGVRIGGPEVGVIEDEAGVIVGKLAVGAGVATVACLVWLVTSGPPPHAANTKARVKHMLGSNTNRFILPEFPISDC